MFETGSGLLAEEMKDATMIVPEQWWLLWSQPKSTPVARLVGELTSVQFLLHVSFKCKMCVPIACLIEMSTNLRDRVLALNGMCASIL